MNIKSAIVRRLSQLVIDSDLKLGAYKLKTTDLLLRQLDPTALAIRTAADSAYRDLCLRSLHLMAGNLTFATSGYAVLAPNADNTFLLFKTRRNTAGLYEVARLAGGVEEAFELLKGKLTGELKGNGKVISNTLIADEVTAAPAAGATQAGRIIRVRSGAGVATSVQMCCLNSADAYEWVVLGTAS